LIRGLDIIEEMDRKGRRVFCAKFDREPKWGHRYNTTGSSFATKVSTWDDDESIQVVSRFYPKDDRKYFEYSNDEDDAINEGYTSIEDNVF